MIQRCFSNWSPTVIRQLYCGIVWPTIESNSPIWNPWLQKDIDMLDKVQRRCERLCSEDLMLQPLTTRRHNADMRETYKILHDHYLLDKTSLFTSSETHQLRGHQLKLAKDYSRTEVRQAFFSNRVVNEWNRLDEAVVMAPTFKCFKSRLELGNKK